MSVSPPKDGEGAGDASPENSDNQMERGEEAQAREAYDFDVKEQDRWLPIANGWLKNFPLKHSGSAPFRKFLNCAVIVFATECIMMAGGRGGGHPREPERVRVACEGSRASMRNIHWLFLHSLKICASICFFILYGQVILP